ncbi:MAG: hypothetical protein ACREAZ_02885 [Nitrososphaera sp.]
MASDIAGQMQTDSVERRASGAVLAFATIAALTVSAVQAHAAQIDASLIPEYDRAVGTFTGTKLVQISYEPGSTVSDIFNGRTERIEFSIEGTSSNGIGELIAAVNRALLEEESPAQITGANITYSGVLKGSPDRLLLTYRVELTSTFNGFKLDQNATDRIPMDINWRGFTVDGPVAIESPELGAVNINQPIGLLEATFPEFAEKLLETEASSIMFEPILDFQEIGEMSMEKWHFLFDPTFSQASSKGVLKGDIGRAKVLSVYSLGECSIREGCPPPKEGDASVTVDGAQLKVHITTPTPNSQIEIAGFTSIEQAGDHQILRVTMDNPAFAIPWFTIQVLLVLGGMMGAVAIFVLVKSRK